MPVAGEFFLEGAGMDELSISGAALTEVLEAALSKKCSLRIQAKGSSMSPFIKDRDIVTISPLADTAISLGTTVVFVASAERRIAVHRVVDKGNARYLIKGDNISGSDGFVEKKSILGYVSGVERNGKKVSWGLGKERYYIALLSRLGILSCIFRAWRRIPFPLRRMILPLFYGPLDK